jgi:RNA polymerase sigma-70 factor (ECF subfamily)
MSPFSPSRSSRDQRFRAIYDANYVPLLGYALRRSGTLEQAADIVAETFLVAWRRIDDIPPGDEGRLWLYGVARRALANQRRRDRRQARLEVRLRLDPSLWRPSAQPDATSEREAITTAFRRLPDRDRELLELVAWEGLAPRHLATVLGCSLVAARVRLYRARKRFARELSTVGVELERRRTGKRLDSVRGGELL